METLSLPEASRRPGPLVTGLRRPRGHAHLALQNAGDERLTALAAAGDEAAFEVLYERYAAAILRYLRRRMRSAEEAEDVHQQVFLSAFSALRAGVEPLHFKAWLYRIAHNVCVSELRMQRPVTGPIDDERGLACLRADAGPRGREDLRELLDDLALLPRAQSTALLLREVHDLSYSEIGETLHVPVGAVRSNIFRARVSLHALAAARELDCSEIRTELDRLAGRRGRRSARIANHLRVCQSCQDYRHGLRRRPVALSLLPLLPLSWQRSLRALFGSPASESTGELAAVGLVAGGVAAGVKLAAVASVVAISVTGAASNAPEPEAGRDAARAVTAPAFAGPQLPGTADSSSSARTVSDPAAIAPVSGLAPGTDPQRAVGINLPVPAAQRPADSSPVKDQPPAAVVHSPTESKPPEQEAPRSAPAGDTGTAAPAPVAAAPGGPSGPSDSGTSGTSGPAHPAPEPGTSSGTGHGQTRNRNRNRSGSSDDVGDSSGTGSAEERQAVIQEPAPEAPADEPAIQEQPAEQPVAEEPAPEQAPAEQAPAEQQSVEQPPVEQQAAAG